MKTEQKVINGLKVVIIDGVMMTNDYAKFNQNKYQRTIDNSHVKKLCKSIEEFGQLQPVVIDKNNNVIDGHHRFNACVELDIPVIINISNKVNGDNYRNIIEMNNNSKKWSLQDYLNVGVTEKIREYEILEALYEKHSSLGLKSIILACCDLNTEKMFTSGKKASMIVNDFKSINLNFDVYEKRISDISYKLGLVEDIMSKLYSGGHRVIGMLLGIFVSHEDYNHKRMMANLEKVNNSYLTFECNRDDIILAITKIYNYRKSEQNKVAFVVNEIK